MSDSYRNLQLKNGQVPSTMLEAVYPVGCIYTEITGTNPASIFGFGTWAAFGAGKVLVGLDAGDTSFDTVKETGGAKTHTLTAGEIPAHNHKYGLRTVSTGAEQTVGLVTASADTSSTKLITDNTGDGGAHNNIQPYIVVYFWERTA